MTGDAKVALRARVRTSRAERPGAEQIRGGIDLADVVLTADPVRSACASGRWVTAYAAMPGEPVTGPLLDRLLAAGARVALPIVRPGGSLAWGAYAGAGSLTISSRGIPEPAADDVGADGRADGRAEVPATAAVLLIPATAVGRDGSRLGQGGGFYDRLLTGLPRRADGGPWRIAIVHDDEVMATVPHDECDQPVDAIATPTRFIII